MFRACLSTDSCPLLAVPCQLSFFLLVLPLFSVLLAQGGDEYGQFAPQDAYLDGSLLAYYGSENEWSQRMFSGRTADQFYKRRGQRQLLTIVQGDPGRALELCHARLNADPQDLESLFLSTVAWAQLGNIDNAMSTMRRALEAGLPLGRFLAGPRRLLAPLTQSGSFRSYLAEHPVALIHGPLLGAVTDHSARFWVPTATEASVAVRVFQGDVSVARSALFRTRSEQDYTAVIEVAGLEPGRRYSYDVLVAGESTQGPTYPSFQTFARQGGAASFRVGFGGGAGYTPQYERIWDTIASQHPSTFLFLGDNVYIDLPERPGPLHDYTYYRRQSREEFRRLVRSTAVYSIWADHDVGIDDVWLGPYPDRPDWKRDMVQLFRNNWNNPAYGDDQWPGCWFKFSIADVDFFMLDGRFYRTNPFAEERTMLGPVQKAWLLRELKRSRAVFKVLVSPVAWALGSKPGSRDTWNGFTAERQEIFDFLAANQINGVVLVSADRHRSEAWRIDREGSYPLYEFSSSRLTNIHTHEIEPGTIFSYNEKCSFGLLDFDTTQSDPEVTFRIVNIDGQLINSMAVKKSQLLHR